MKYSFKLNNTEVTLYSHLHTLIEILVKNELGILAHVVWAGGDMKPVVPVRVYQFFKAD